MRRKTFESALPLHAPLLSLEGLEADLSFHGLGCTLQGRCFEKADSKIIPEPEKLQQAIRRVHMLLPERPGAHVTFLMSNSLPVTSSAKKTAAHVSWLTQKNSNCRTFKLSNFERIRNVKCAGPTGRSSRKPKTSRYVATYYDSRFRGSKACGRVRKNNQILVSMCSQKLVESRFCKTFISSLICPNQLDFLGKWHSAISSSTGGSHILHVDHNQSVS